MFRPPTLFIVGAGASCELKLPAGDALKTIIATKLNFEFEDFRGVTRGDRELWPALLLAAGAQKVKPEVSHRAARRIVESMPMAISIDTFLDHHRHDAAIVAAGKIAIVKSIADAEAVSALRPDNDRKPTPDFGPLEQTWYGRLFKLLTDGANSPELLDVIFDRVAFITFNYDRCIEHYLFQALRTYFDMVEDDAARLMGKLKIIHVYGSIAPLPWQGGSQTHRFGANLAGPQLFEASSRIRIFTEQLKDEALLKKIRREVSRAHRVIFLGCSYYQQNLQLLEADSSNSEVREIFGTTYGLSNSRSAAVNSHMLSSYRTKGSQPTVHLMSATAADLFEEYGHSFVW